MVKSEMPNIKRCKLNGIDKDIAVIADYEDCLIEYNNNNVVNSWCNGDYKLKSKSSQGSLTRLNGSVMNYWNKDNVNESMNKRKNPYFDSELLLPKKQIVEVEVCFVDDVNLASNYFVNGNKKVKNQKSNRFYGVQDFVAGDIVWAKCSNRFPAWPAVVIHPQQEAPVSVLKAFVPNTICVMFYGYSKRGTRDYAWVKGGMIFPFLEYMQRDRLIYMAAS